MAKRKNNVVKKIGDSASLLSKPKSILGNFFYLYNWIVDSFVMFFYGKLLHALGEGFGIS